MYPVIKHNDKIIHLLRMHQYFKVSVIIFFVEELIALQSPLFSHQTEFVLPNIFLPHL